MKKRLFHIKPLILTAFVILFISGCQGVATAPNAPADVTGNEPPQSEPSVFADGYIMGIQEDRSAILVTKYVKSESQEYVDPIWFLIDQQTSFETSQNVTFTQDQLQLGQRVNVTHSGPVMESYPVRTTAQTIEYLPPTQDILYASNGLASAIRDYLQTTQVAGAVSLASAISQIDYDPEFELWNVAIVSAESIDKPHIAQIDGKTGQYVFKSNKAFRIFAPEPNNVVGTSFTVVGRARVFEATLQYRLEDGHNILAEGFTTATEGGPAWGDFEIQLEYERPTSPSLTLILYESSAEDGQPIHELLLPLKVDPELIGDAP